MALKADSSTFVKPGTSAGPIADSDKDFFSFADEERDSDIKLYGDYEGGSKLSVNSGLKLTRSKKEEKSEHAVFIKLGKQKVKTPPVVPPILLEIFAVDRMRINGDIIRQQITKE